jgi:hypothetical protein
MVANAFPLSLMASPRFLRRFTRRFQPPPIIPRDLNQHLYARPLFDRKTSIARACVARMNDL